jgi:ATP-binding cassette subfamily B protein
MSKQGAEGVDKPRREKERVRKNRIPDLEWLFEGENKSTPQKDNFIKKLFRRDWWKIVYTTFLYVLQNSPLWVLPLITSDVIDLITYMPAGFGWRLLLDGVIAFLFVVLNVPTTTWRSGVLNRWIHATTAEIKSGVVRKLQRMSITYHKDIEEGRIQSKFLRDIDGVQNYYACITGSLLPQIVATVGSVAIALWKSPLVTLFFVAIIPLNVFLTKAFGKRIRKDNRAFRQENEKLSAKLTTTLQMMTLTKAHGLIMTEEIAVTEKIDSVKTAALKRDKTLALFGSMMFVSSHLLSAVCLFFCAFLAVKGIISAGRNRR